MLARKLRRVLALFLALTMVLSLAGLTTLASGDGKTGHTDGCGYVCTHVHDDGCGAVRYEDSTDPADGYAPAREAAECPNGAACTGEEADHVEPQDAADEVMGRKAVVTAADCTHTCTEDEWVCAADCATLVTPMAAGGLEIGERFTEGLFTYKVLSADTVDLVSLVDKKNLPAEVVVPAAVTDENGTEYAVTAMSALFQLNNTMTSLEIQAPITELGNSQFMDCTSLSRVVLPDTLKVVGIGAFSGCTALTAITLPEGLETIASSSFKETGLTEIKIPAGVTELQSMAFQMCEDLRAVSGGEGLTALPLSAFEGCTALETLDGFSNVTEIGDNVFFECGKLHRLNGLDLSKLTAIGESAFDSCTALAYDLNLSSLRELGFYAFYKSGVKSVTLPEGLTEVPDYAFYNCNNLLQATIPNSVTEIGEQAFSYAGSCPTIVIGSNDGSRLQAIGEKAFYAWAGYLYDITIHGCSDDIQQGAFAWGDSVPVFTVAPIDAKDDCISEGGTSLQAAIDAAAETPDAADDTISISKNILLEKTVVIPDGADITLTAGAAYTITTAKGFTGPMFRVPAGAALTLDGELTYLASRMAGGAVVETSGSLTLSDGTIRGVNASSSSAAAVKVNGGTFTMSGGRITANAFSGQYAGSVHLADGTAMTMTGGEITGNTAQPVLNTTPGILVDEGASLTMEGGKISNNSGYRGGGVFLMGGTAEGFTFDETAAARFTMTGGEISGNQVNGEIYVSGRILEAGGGGVFVQNNARFTMTGGVISGNFAEGLGGGVSTQSPDPASGGGIFLFNGGTISGNTANSGGGIYSFSADAVRLNKGRIENNTAKSLGGGIYVSTQPYTADLSSVLVTGNHAAVMGGGIWACPMGTVSIGGYGFAAFDNTADGAGADVAILNKMSDIGETTLSQHLLGGGLVNWHQDGAVYAVLLNGMELGAVREGVDRYDAANPGAPVSGIQDSKSSYALKAVLTDDAKALAEAAAAVVITGNTASRGGGIGTNGVARAPDCPPEDLTELSVRKVWSGSGSRPDAVTVNLIMIDGERQLVIGTVQLSEANQWRHTFTGLDAGKTYTVTEESVEHYRTSIVQDPETGEYVITNTYESDRPSGHTLSVSVEKVWEGDSEAVRPEGIQVALLRDGKSYEEVTLSEANGWKHTWKGLSERYDWSVAEMEVPEGYTSSSSHEDTQWVITNTYEPKGEDPNHPKDPGEDPEELTDIGDGDVPSTSMTSEETEADEPEIPLGDAPNTGDSSLMIFLVLTALLSAAGAAALLLTGRKRAE